MDELTGRQIAQAASPEQRWFSAFAVTSAALVAATGTLVLTGWVLGIEAIKRVHPDLVAMNPTTAAAFILAGLALWLRRSETRPTWQIRAGQAAAALVLAVGLLKLVSDTFGLNWPVDQILFRSWLDAEPPGTRGRMASSTAGAFSLMGAALLSLDFHRQGRWRIAEPLALAAAGLATLMLVGYLYGVQPGDGGAPFIPMALHTSVAFLVLAAGSLAARPQHGFISHLASPRSGGIAARRMLPGAVGIVLVLGWMRLEGQQLELFGSEFGVSLMSASTIIMLAALVWYNSAALDRADRRREDAESDLRRAHAALQDKSQLLEAILDSVGDAILVTDGAGRTLHKNPAAEQLLGPAPNDLPVAEWADHYGLLLPDLSGPVPADRCPAVLAERGETVLDQEQFLSGNAGEGAKGRWLSVSAQPLRSRTGRSNGAVVILRDITDRKLAEQTLEGRNQALEAMVSARTADLQRSNEELQQFAYVASHDLQEPLRMVGSYLQLLERRYKDRLDDDGLEFIGYAVDGANRMKQLINDLLQFSRVDSKGGSMVETDSRRAFDDAVANLEAAIAEAGAEVSAGELPRVNADPAQLRQLFQNLIGNAVKFRGEAPPRVRVEAEPTGDGWVFTVADNGIGLDPQYSDRIFEVFQRLHGREKYPGTGIGLAICKKIVERHGGAISVRSRAGEGATFSFTIPTKKGNTHAHRHAA